MPKKISFADIAFVLLFITLFFYIIFKLEFKLEIQIYLILGGIIALAALFSKPFFKISIPYTLLGLLVYIINFETVHSIMNLLNPNDGWVEIEGQRHRIMQMNWTWGFLSGFIISPLFVFIYRKTSNRNIILETSLICGFILITILHIIF